MASIFSLDKQVASLPKHGFSMSQTLDFTSSCGHLLPIYFDQLNPGEKWRYKVDLFTRTQPLAAPANIDIDEYVDVFFVPLRKISAAADNILFQISDLPSSSLPATTTDFVLPLLDLDLIKCDISGGSSNTYLGTWSTGYTQYGSYDVFFESVYSGLMRLMDIGGLDPNVLISSVSAYRPKISPAYFAVYQAIYYDYYRLSSWEGNQITAYNLDAGYSTLDLLSTGMPWATSFGLRNLLELRHRAWYKDYFTSVFPAPLISSTGMLAAGVSNLTSVNQWLISNSLIPIDPNAAADFNEPSTITPSLGTFNNVTVAKNVSTASLRTMFAVDKLLKVTARAGKHYDDQVLAHFGFKVPKGFSDEVVHLGTHHQQIHIGEVISTASTSTGEIGELAGKGYGKAVNQIVDSFTAPCHGYVMAIYSCVPRISYIGGLDRIHTMVRRFDWFIPELDNLGMQPMFSFELNELATTPTGRAAWQLRYMQMKCKAPRSTYAFLTKANGLTGSIYNNGPFAEWNITDPFPFAGPSFQTINFPRLLVSPSMLNSVMLVNYVPTPSGSQIEGVEANPQNLYASDPLIHHCVQSVSKVSGMSIYGLDDRAI